MAALLRADKPHDHFFAGTLMRSAIAVANYFIEIARREGVKELPVPKVHALVYLAQGWLLGASGQPIIGGTVMADRDGIFIPELREAGCRGTRDVNEPVSKIDFDEARGMMVEQTPSIAPNDPVISALQWVWKTYGPLPAFKIATHLREHGGPWDLIWNDEERDNDDPKAVPNVTIRAWFKQLTTRRQSQSAQQLSEPERSERRPKLGDTQNMLAQPDPNRLRRT